MTSTIHFNPIGFFRFQKKKKYELARQPLDSDPSIGMIQLSPGKNFEQALEGLNEFDRIWVLFSFHASLGWKPKVLPTRYHKKMGLFATRSPYRPCSIGMSCVKLVDVQKNYLLIQGFDLLDETPILDIKPYIPYCDSFSNVKSGWVDEALKNRYTVNWTQNALSQRDFLSSKGVHFQSEVFSSLEYFIGPSHYNRIKWIEKDLFVLAYKAFRFVVKACSLSKQVTVLYLTSGFDLQELLILDEKEKEVHQLLLSLFPDNEYLHIN